MFGCDLQIQQQLQIIDALDKNPAYRTAALTDACGTTMLNSGDRVNTPHECRKKSNEAAISNQ